MSLELSIVNYKSSYYPNVLDLRNRILRMPLGMELGEHDIFDDRNQYIFIGIKDNVLVACVMLKILDDSLVKLRQMAVDTLFQREGVGTLLLRYVENFCLLNEYKQIELHARKEAINFYTKLGYQSIGNEFVEINIPHIKMIKQIEVF